MIVISIQYIFMQALLVRLMVLGTPRMPAPRRLVNPEEDDEEDGDEPDGVDTDTFLQQLAGACACTKSIKPKSIWYASKAELLMRFYTRLGT